MNRTLLEYKWMKVINVVMTTLSLLVFSTIFFVENSNAITAIDIKNGRKEKILMGLGKFTANNSKDLVTAEEIKLLINRNLEFSGIFKTISSDYFFAKENNDEGNPPKFENLRRYNLDSFVNGSIRRFEDGRIEIKYRVWDVIFSELMTEGSFIIRPKYWYNIANVISDRIYQQFTGREGFFNSKIVYVGEKGVNRKRRYIVVTDFSGNKHYQLTNGKYFVSTPRFSPSGKQIVYMSYSDIGRPASIWMIDFADNSNKKIIDSPYMSFAPRFSPSGGKLLLSMAVEDNIEIFEFDLRSEKLRRLTYDSAIDTSASYSPTEDKIVFNSDRQGGQQLYVMDANGANVRRISYGNGRYASPVWSPTGNLIAFTKMYKGRFYIGVMNSDGTNERLLTSSFSDDSPAWAPNGMGIIFTRESRFNDYGTKSAAIYFVDLEGNNLVRIPTPTNALETDWQKI